MSLAGKSVLVTGRRLTVDACAPYRRQLETLDYRNELSPPMPAEATLFPLSPAGAAINGQSALVDAALCLAPPAPEQK